MPAKNVHIKLNFDENGNITEVENTKTGAKCTGKKMSEEPLTDVIGMATLVLAKGDDPCVIQGGIKWCW